MSIYTVLRNTPGIVIGKNNTYKEIDTTKDLYFNSNELIMEAGVPVIDIVGIAKDLNSRGYTNISVNYIMNNRFDSVVFERDNYVLIIDKAEVTTN